MPAGVGDGIYPLLGQVLYALANNFVHAECTGDRAQVPSVQDGPQLLLYSYRQIVVAHERSGLREVVQRVHCPAVSTLDDLLRDRACAYALWLWLACGAVEAVVLRLGFQHCLCENNGHLGRCCGHEGLHALRQMLSGRTEGLRSLCEPVCPLGHVVGFLDAAGHVQEDVQLEVVKCCRRSLGVVLDL